MLLLLTCLTLTAFAQQKQVRVTLKKGTVVEGAVETPNATVEPPKAGNAVEETVSTAGTGFKGFLLESGNNVYLDCISDPMSVDYNEAALDVLKRQMRRDGFWNIVERPEDAHFSIVCLAILQGKTNVAIAINSRLTGKNEVLGEMKGPEDVDEYRKIVWELYNKFIIPLHKKIEKGEAPHKLKKNFTL